MILLTPEALAGLVLGRKRLVHQHFYWHMWVDDLVDKAHFYLGRHIDIAQRFQR